MTTSFHQLEVDFQRKLNEYTSVYKDYMVELDNQRGTYWNTEENVTIKNAASNAQIPFVHYPNINKQECLHECSSDDNCNYVLFSDSGNGECAANQCLKWTTEAQGFKTPPQGKVQVYTINVGNSGNNPKVITLPAEDLTVYPIPINPQDPEWNNTFRVSVSGSELSVTRTDENSGWGQFLQLMAIGGTSGVSTYEIKVGSSNTNTKTVTLPSSDLTVIPTPINIQNPDWGNTFNVSVSGTQLSVTRTDQDIGWGQDLVFRAYKSTSGVREQNKACQGGIGPSYSYYIYDGWSKPTWTDSPNVSFMGNPNTMDSKDWKDLGSEQSLTACKEKSISSSNGPFSSVVFLSNDVDSKWKNKCYGGIPSTQLQSLNVNGVYSSVPPEGSANLGGQSALEYVMKLKTLNTALKDDIHQMMRELDSLVSKDKKMEKVIEKTHTNLTTDYQKLNKDKIKLDELTKELNSLDGKNGVLSRVTTREKMLYFGTLIIFLILLGFIVKRYS